MVTVGNAIAFLTLDTSKYTSSLAVAQRQMEQFGNRANDSETRLAGLNNTFQTVGKTMTLGVTMPLMAVGTMATKTAIELEDAFAGIRKTTEATEEEFAQIRQELDNLAKVTPVAVEELYKIGEVGGQLGIAKESLVDFTSVMADVGVATNMTAEQAATSFARIANIMETSQEDFDRLGSAVVDLGNNFSTSESEITEMSLRLAGTGNQIGLTEAQVLSFSTAMSSMGINAESGGSSMSRVWQKINTEVLSGGENLVGFANIAGMSASDFSNTWKNEPQDAIVEFIKGLGNIKESGGDVTTALKAMGISSIQEVDTLSRLSGASDVLVKSLEVGTKAWEENTALQDEAAEKYKTTASQLQIMKNYMVLLGDSIGQILLPMLNGLIKAVVLVVGALDSLPKGIKVVIVGIGLLVAAIGPMLLLLSGTINAFNTVKGSMVLYAAGAKVAAAGTWIWNAANAAAIPVATTFGIAVNSILWPIGLLVVAIGAVVGGITLLVRKFKSASKDIDDSTKDMESSIDDLVKKANSPDFDMSEYLKVGEDMSESISDGIDIASDKPVDSMKDMNSKMIDELTKTKDTMQKSMEENISSLDKFGDAIITALKNRYQTMQDNQLRHLDRKLDNEKDTSDKQLDLIQRIADSEKNSLNSRLDALKANTDDRVREYEREYDEKLRILNLEASQEVGSIQGEIDAIDAITAKEDKAMAEREYKYRLSELNKAKSTAETSEERAKIQQDINNHIQRRNRQLILEERAEKKEALRQEIQDVKDANEEKKDILKESLEEKKAQAKEELEAEQEVINEQILMVEAGAKQRIEIEKARIQQVIDILNSQKEATREHYSELMEQENLFAESRQMIIKNNNDEIIQLLSTYNPKWQDAGQSFSDSMINGLNSNNETMAAAIDRNLNITPVIQEQKKSIQSLEKQIESLKAKDEDLLPKATEGMKESEKATSKSDESFKKVSKTMDKTSKDYENMGQTDKEFWETLAGNVTQGTGIINNGLDDYGQNLDSTLERNKRSVVMNGEDMSYQLMSAFENTPQQAEAVGEGITAGLDKGIHNEAPTLMQRVRNLGKQISEVFAGVLDINSPSRVFEGFGVNIGEGLLGGMDAMIPNINHASEEMANATIGDYEQMSNITQSIEIEPVSNLNYDDVVAGRQDTGPNLSDSAIDRLIDALTKPKDDGGAPVPIVLQLDGAELARTTINNIRDYEKQTGRIVLG